VSCFTIPNKVGESCGTLIYIPVLHYTLSFNSEKVKTMRSILLVLSALIVMSCGGGGDSSATGGTTPVQGDLIANSSAKTLRRSEPAGVTSITTFAIASGLNVAIQNGIKYDVDYYVLTYKTLDPVGNLVNASGLILVPKKPTASSMPLLSLQHGTLVYEPWAPSYADGTLNGTTADVQQGFIAAATGYVVMLPDYLGYGASKNIFHPYIHAQTLAAATIDMIRASRRFLTQNNIATNNQLFLAGYSEGGYATLAAQKEMETTLSGEFQITATEPGAGPYDMTATTRTVFAAPNLTGISDPMYLAFLLTAYDRYYNNPSQLSSYLTTTALNCNNSYFIGYYGINPLLTQPYYDNCINTLNTAAILNPPFLSAFNGVGETALKANIAQNDIYNWTPQVPTRLYYSPADDIVPAANTLTAYTTMVTTNGATKVATATCNVRVSSIHGNCGLPFMNDVFGYFGGMAQDL